MSDWPPGRPELSVVIVNYQNWGDVAPLVETLARSPRVAAGACEILVVDNASAQPIPPGLATPPTGVRLILEPANRGFSAGVNAGWRASRGRWLLVLNPDIVAAPDLIDQILQRIATYEARAEASPGIVGFGLRNPDGTRQPSVGAFPSLVRTVWEQVIPRSRRKYQPEWRLRPGPVDWVTGACFLIAEPFLALVGGMDEDFFLYYEEVALCREAARRGWVVEYDPSVAVVHLRPLQNRAVSTKMRIITRHSKLLYFHKHLPAWQLHGLAWVIRVEARVQAIRWRLLGQRRKVLAWQAVGRLASRPRRVAEFGGRMIRALAQSVEDAADPEGDQAADHRPGSGRVVGRLRRGVGMRRARGSRPTLP